MPAFDWYQATVKADRDDVLEAVMGLREGSELKHRKGMYGYATCSVVEAHDGPVAQVWHGGRQELPHVVFSGFEAIEGADLLRSKFSHSVTRCDVREDFAGADTFDRFLSPVLAAAKRHRVKVRCAGDHLLTLQARTVYLGSPSSAVVFRQYDRAAKLRDDFANNPMKLAEVPDHLTRTEVQVRPPAGMARTALASMEPEAVFGVTDWMRDLWREFSGSEVERFSVTKPWRQSDDDRAYDAMMAQYGRMLRRRMEDHGSWAALGQQIGLDLDLRADAERALKGRS